METSPTKKLTTPEAKALSRKVSMRILPFVALMYFINYVDRTAIAFAGPNGMNEDLQLTASMFGLVSGIFFIGYILLEVPSNIIMMKVGARIWLMRIMVTWGIIATLTAFVQSFEMLLVLRFLLGVAEAGLGPAILLYITYWFPNSGRVKAVSIYLLGIPLSSVIVSPLATWLIQVGDGIWGLEGWRFMILMTGIPAIVVGVIAYFYLADRPEKARWLTPPQAAAITAEIEAETDVNAKGHSDVKSAFKNPKVWLLSVAYLGIVYGLYGIGFFLPTMIGGFSERFGTTFSAMETALLISIPYTFAAVSMVLWARSSARRGEIGWHTMIMTAVGGFGILLSAYFNDPWMIMIGVTLCAVGLLSAMPVVWGLPARILTGTGAAAGFAIINSLGNFGGFAGPAVTGWLLELTGGPQLPFTVLAILLFISGAIVVYVQRVNRAQIAASLAEVTNKHAEVRVSEPTAAQ